MKMSSYLSEHKANQLLSRTFSFKVNLLTSKVIFGFSYLVNLPPLRTVVSRFSYNFCFYFVLSQVVKGEDKLHEGLMFVISPLGRAEKDDYKIPLFLLINV